MGIRSYDPTVVEAINALTAVVEQLETGGGGGAGSIPASEWIYGNLEVPKNTTSPLGMLPLPTAVRGLWINSETEDIRIIPDSDNVVGDGLLLPKKKIHFFPLQDLSKVLLKAGGKKAPVSWWAA